MTFDEEKIKNRSLSSIKYIINLGLITRILLGIKRSLIDKNFAGSKDILAYNIIFVQAILISRFLSDSISDALVRLYRKVEEREGREKLFAFINNLISIVGLVVSLTISLFIIIIVNKDIGHKSLILMGAIIVLIASIKAVLTAFLQMKHGFLAGTQGNLLRAVIYVVCIFLFGDKLSVDGLMLVGIIATLSQLYIAIKISRKNDFKYEFRLNFKDKYLSGLFINVLLIISSVILYDLSISTKHSNMFMRYFNELIIGAIITVTYPILAEMHERYVLKENSYLKFNQVFNNILVLLMKLILPFLIMMVTMSGLIKDLFLENTLGLPNLLIYYGIGFISMILLPLMFKALISFEKYKELTLVTLISFFLGRVLEDYGTSHISQLGREIGLLIGLITSLYILNKETEFMGNKKFKLKIRGTFKAAGYTFLVVFLFKLIYEYVLGEGFTNDFIMFSIMTIIGGYTYLNLLYRVKIKERY